MGEAAFAFELLEVVDRIFFAGAEHGSWRLGVLG